MATVTGTLRDFNTQSLGTTARMVFTPSSPGFSPTAILAARPVVVQPSSTGSFSVELEPTVTVSPETWYTLRVDWLDSEGGYVATSFFDGRLFVPETGGKLTDLIDVSRPPTIMFASLTPPLNPTPGLAWLETDPDNPDNPLNTGNIYEWSA
ncbi:hypothetical protein [Curtobacterium sp. BRD11]|uniref:hypothetical protein n=1 Tax=Curtobacterium sp. BRD11 TaxID=2962581 RepID=UPI0028819775|nr:hypothetical protein [Curtobacterium sp. BRD11]MDT0211249.1 hypothetical protein [Curtobacterium sp. BRD11]